MAVVVSQDPRDGALYARCDRCAQSVTLCHRDGQLMLAAHAMPAPPDKDCGWVAGDRCPDSRRVLGRVVEL